jgi:Domain of unknown function (DUF4169)
MSADIVNLRKVRKDKARAKKAKRADENSAKFGRSKAEREKTTAETELTRRRFEGLKRDDKDGVGPGKKS